MWIPSSLRGAVPCEEVPQADVAVFSRQGRVYVLSACTCSCAWLVNVVACRCLCCSRSDVVRAQSRGINVGDAKNIKIVVFSQWCVLFT